MRASKLAGPQRERAGHVPRMLLLLPALLLFAACASQGRLTARATGCSSRDITIVGSEFRRQGVETAWCARCGAKLYQCATNADRTDVKCFEPKEGGPCS